MLQKFFYEYNQGQSQSYCGGLIVWAEQKRILFKQPKEE